MTKPAWPERLAKTISKFSPKANVAQFRDEYAEIVRTVPDDKKSNAREVLLEVRSAIESWVTEEDKCPCCALREWTKFYDAAGSMPVSLLIAIAKKLPQAKSGTVDWQPFFFSCRHKALLTTLFDRRMVAKGHLQAWVSDKLRDAYPLPVLDLAIDNDAVGDYRGLWSGSLKWGNRPAGLQCQEEILAACYAREPVGSLDKDLSSYLVDNPKSRGPFYKAVLRHPMLYLRLAELLASMSGDGSLVDEFVKACGDELRNASSATSRAALALASMRLFVAARAEAQDKSAPASAVVAAASKHAASEALRHVEEDTSSKHGANFSLLSAIDLHDIVHGHLKSLSTATADSSGPAERSSQYERHLGKKEVLDKVLGAMNESTNDESLRDGLEVSLFNLGVRPLGKPGQATEFDSRLHEAEKSGIVPGDKVEIVEPGRQLGKDADMLVLSKAIVRERK